ncbi:hypothetical protein DTL21_04395 [Bremerella cremea]|uniref:Uncharacterized protein n=1 Tax=Blastopirellula marina TaxID=124 RepID=A0A2S8FYC7_9BACT|nr:MULTISPECIES: hypothetical protein [Pirellulaceae]PQO37197.1 hypothetical protein C5Y83_04395 [Blastopirellula marina]RCS49584.1 hypothetical protein DTL21_04395 [Bremerella cremea]
MLETPKGTLWANSLIGHPTLLKLEVNRGLMSDDQMKGLLLANTLEYLEINSVPIGDLGLVTPFNGMILKSLTLRETNVTTTGVLSTFGPSCLEINCVHNNNWHSIELKCSSEPSGPSISWGGILKPNVWKDLHHCQDIEKIVVGVPLPIMSSQPFDLDSPLLGAAHPASRNQDIIPIDDQAIEIISKLPALKSLVINAAGKVSSQGLNSLAEESQLENLTLNCCGITDDHMIKIGAMSFLKHLSLDYNPISHQGLKELTHLRELQTLSLNTCERLDDRAGISISQLRKLQRLEAFHTAIGDNGIKQLHGMPNLMIVYISGEGTTHEGILELLSSLPTANAH